jgi:hypothetical protein
MTNRREIISAIASADLKAIARQKDKIDRGVKVYTSADAFLYDVYKSVMRTDGPGDIGEHELRLNASEQAKLKTLSDHIKSRQ